MADDTIGFIGLGLMGAGFVERLGKSGYRVVGHDIDPARMRAAAALGVEPAASAAEVARRAPVTLVCVTTTDAVAAVVAGVCEAGRREGAVLVDHSTTDIARTRAVATELRERTGAAFVDAPVSGGPGAAVAGTLAIMAGGEAEAIGRISPAMGALGRFTHMGGVGAGQATKLVNQALVLSNYCVIAEALRLAQAFGVDAGKVPEALATGHAGSNLLPILFERMIAEDFEPRGFARQVLKDLEMLNDAAHDKRLAMPMASQALMLFRMLNARGDSERDGAAVVTLLPKQG